MSAQLTERVDDSAGLKLVTKDGAGREDLRVVWTALDVIDPDRKYQLENLRDGGEEVESRCLRRTPNYIPRCEFTPLETWFEPIGIPELAGDAMKDLVTVGGLQPQVPENVNPSQFFRKNEPMMGLPHYPGLDLPILMTMVGYRGVREIAKFRAATWESGEIQRIQNEFFPRTWDKRHVDGSLPIALRVIEERVREVSAGGLALHGNDMLLSIDHSRRWATTRIGVENGLLQTRTAHQHTYSYSKVAFQLMAQLEIEPRDAGTETSRLAKEIVTALLAAQSVQAQPANINQIVEEAVKAALLAQASPADSTAPDADVKEFKCDWCEETFGTENGKTTHMRQWCKTKPE